MEIIVKYNKTEEAIISLISDQLNWGREAVSYDCNFADDLAADSLDMVEMIMAFEELLGCEVADKDAEMMVRVKDVFDYCEKHGLSV